MSCKPYGEINIEIVFCFFSIPSGHNRKRACEPEREQYEPFNNTQAKADPQPFVNPVGDGGIQHIKDHYIKENPDQGMNGFHQCQLGFDGHNGCKIGKKNSPRNLFIHMKEPAGRAICR